MAEGAIIFLLKVVYFSIERWCTFGLTNTNDKFLNNKDIFIKTLDEVYTAKMKSYEKINDEILKLEVKYSYTESNIKLQFGN